MKLSLTSRIVLVFAVLATGLLAAVGFHTYRSGRESLKDAAISEMLATEVEKDAAMNLWVDERLVDLRQLASPVDLTEKVANLIDAAPGSPAARAAHEILLQELGPPLAITGSNLTELFVMEPERGRVVASTNPAEEGKSKIGYPYFQNGKKGFYLQPPYYSLDLREPTLVAAIPLRASNGRMIAVLAARLDLGALTAIVQRRAGLRLTVDAFLINADRYPVTQPRFIIEPVVLRRRLDSQAVRLCAARNNGVILSPDYRGIPGIEAYRWDTTRQLGLIVKIDQAEAFAPVRAFTWLLVRNSILALLVAIWLTILLANTITGPLRALQGGVKRFAEGSFEEPLVESSGDEVGQVAREFNRMAARVVEHTAELAKTNDALQTENAERRRVEELLRESEKEFRTLAESMPQIVWTTRPDGWNTYFNQQWMDYTGLTLGESLGHGWNKPFHPDDQQKAWDAWQHATAGRGVYSLESRLRRADGVYRWWLVRGVPLKDAAGSILKWFGTCTDIHDLKLAELEIARSNRALELLSACNNALFRLDQEKDLLEEICRVAVETGGYRMAWVGYARDDESKSIAPMAHAGVEEGFLSEIKFTWNENSLRGQGLLGQTIRDGQARVCSDFTQEPRFASWLPHSDPRGYRGMISLPLRDATHSFGVIALYIGDVRQPSTKEMQLLQEMADNLAFGIGALRDRSARKQAEASRARLTAILEATTDLVGISDLNGNILYINLAGRNLIGMNIDEDISSARIVDFLPGPANHPSLIEGIPTAVRQGAWSGEVTLLSRGGHEFPVSQVILAHKTPDGKVEYLSTIMRDITERKRAEAALREAHDQLELRVEQRTAELQMANVSLKVARDAADAANAAKSEFLSRMSHELRTPLNAILGFGQILESREPDPVESECLEHIRNGGEHLLELVNDILDISSIEAGRFHVSMEPTSVEEVTSECFDLIRPIARQNGVRLIENPERIGDWYVRADKQRLKQVLIDLLTNAVNYNHEGGQVSVSCKEAAACRLRIEVSDTGTGLSPEFLEKLFVPFERLNADQAGVEGTGLGLVLSRRLVEAMNGTIGVESVWGVGSTFYINLEIAEAPLNSAASIKTSLPPAVPVAGECSVLFIEDNLSNYRLIEFALAERPGVQLTGAMQGSVGLEIARRNIPDLILLDVHLPDIRGDEVLRLLRGYPETKDIPVVVISADATPSQIEQLIAGGARGYMTKPFNIKELLKVVDETIREKNSREEI